MKSIFLQILVSNFADEICVYFFELNANYIPVHQACRNKYHKISFEMLAFCLTSINMYKEYQFIKVSYSRM